MQGSESNHRESLSQGRSSEQRRGNNKKIRTFEQKLSVAIFTSRKKAPKELKKKIDKGQHKVN